VVRVVGAGDTPLPVDDAVIEELRVRMAADGGIVLEENPLVSGDPVRITAGPMAGWEGIFHSLLSDAQRVVILLDTILQARLVVQRDWVERAEAA
jgi:transcription antitermination factor NusG